MMDLQDWKVEKSTVECGYSFRACVDPGGGGGRGSAPPPPEKSQMYSNYQASIQYWIIIGPPAKLDPLSLL